MKIRTKMMLWYTLLTSILLLIFLPVLYSSISNSLYGEAESSAESIVSLAETGIEYENNAVSWDENTAISEDTPTIVYSMNDTLIYKNSLLDLTDFSAFETGAVRRSTFDGMKWIVLDENIQKEGRIVAKIRVYYNLDSVNKTLGQIKLMIAFAVPFYFIITIFGGLLIAKKALYPITKVTKTAKSIGRDDLSNRITGNHSHDEVNELIDTFNDMLERLEESFEKEKRFASDASHELRTPVSIIMAYTDTLLKEIESESTIGDLQKSLEVIDKESRRMNTIISQLLTLTRGYEGRYKLVMETIDLSEVIENVIEELEDMAKDANIEVSFKNTGTIHIEADQSLITQLMLNFIENAIKYGKSSGHVWISIVQRNDETITIIEDDGIGIDEEEQKHIFERFFRADQARDRKGTGLGLAIAKWIVEEHRGRIEVSSNIGKGTTFEIRFPRSTRMICD